MTAITNTDEQKKRIYCTVTQEEHARLTLVAAERGMTVSQMLVRIALAQGDGGEDPNEQLDDAEDSQYNSGVAPAFLHELNRVIIILTSRPVLRWAWPGMHELRVYLNNLYCDAANYGTRLDEVMKVIDNAAIHSLHQKPIAGEGFFIRDNLVKFCECFGVTAPPIR